MRSLFLRTSLFAALVCPIAAHASTTITVTPATGPVVVYTLSSGPDGSYTNYFTEPARETSGGTSMTDELFFYNTADGGGFYDAVTGLNLGGAQLFTGSTTNPVFSSEFVNLQLVDANGNPIGGSDAVAVSATPEPSSLMLLGTGAAGLITAYRRRRRA